MSDNEPGIPRENIIEGYTRRHSGGGISSDDNPPFITIPGSTLPGYGVGYNDPIDVPYVNPSGKKIRLISNR